MRKLLDTILNAAAVVSTVITVLVTVLLLYEVATRYFVRHPSMWSLDFTMYSICYLTFFGAAWLQREGGHVRVELLTQALKPKYRALVMGLTSAVACLACSIFCWIAASASLSSYFEKEFIDGSIVVPRFLVIGIMPIGLFLLALELFREAWEHFETFSVGGKERPKGPEEMSI